jgi:hypothetical protein
MAVGRISGPLLKDNLLRNGVNLAFETSLLYLDVVNSRVGINTTTPANELSVNGTTRTTNLYTSNTATLGTFTFSGSTISSLNSTITLSPAGPNATIYQGTISVNNLTISGNTINATGVNTDINITPSGTGKINLNSNVLVNGNLHVTGNITADGGNSGNISLGNQTTDTITFTGEVNSDILPSQTNFYNLGSASPSLRWANVYTSNIAVSTVNAETLNTTDFQTANLDISGNTISAITPNTDINFTTTGTGGIVFGNLKFTNNTITNIVPNAVTEFAQSGSGYVKIDGTYGVVIPVGDTISRPTVLHEETGMIRFNTDLLLVEVFDGVSWVSVAGSSGGITAATAQDLAIGLVLSLG